MRIAITGATGFIGRYMVEGLAREGHTLRALIRPGREDALFVPPEGPCELHSGDLTKPETIEASRRLRIANGSGTQPNEVSNLVNQFKQMQKLMKRMGGMGSKRMKPQRGKKGKKAKAKKGGGGRVQGGRTNGRVSSRTTPKKGQEGSQKLVLPGLNDLEENEELQELLKDLN